jgi:hypothetical protein
MNATSTPATRTSKSAWQSRLSDWGDRLCCAVLVAAALGAAALFGWYVWQMPSMS